MSDKPPMDAATQRVVCLALAKAGMWGQMGVMSVAAENLDKAFTVDRSFRRVLDDVAQEAKDAVVGTVTDETAVKRLLAAGCSLNSYEPGRLAVHWPNGGGLRTYIVGPLAEKYGQTHDARNYRIHHERQQAVSPLTTPT